MPSEVWFSLISVGGVVLGGALTRPTGEWDETHPGHITTQDVMNRLWVAERLIRILFPLPVHDAARTAMG
jgi:hypothetical protein